MASTIRDRITNMMSKMKELIDPGSVRWGLLPAGAYYIVVRVFVIILIFLSLGIWLVVTESAGWIRPGWLSWLDIGGMLIPAAIIVGLVQIFVITFLILRMRAKNAEGHEDWCSWNQFVKTSKVILRLTLFEWTVVNLMVLLLTLSLTDQPQDKLPYDTNWAFAITVGSALIHYYLYVRSYLGKKPMEYWRKKDIIIVMTPFVLIVFVLLIVVIILYVGISAVILVETAMLEARDRLISWMVVLIILVIFSFILIPLLVYYVLVRPIQRRRFQRRAAAEPLVASKQPTIMEKAIRKKCEEKLTAIEEMRSLLLIGLGIDRVDGLDRAYCLSRLYLSCNQIVSAAELSHLPSIETLNLEDNMISSYAALLPLRHTPSLRRLNIERNPLCSQKGFDLAKIARMLPQLVSVGGIDVSAAIRKQAAAIPDAWLDGVVLAAEKQKASEALEQYAPYTHQFLVHRSRGTGEVLVGVPVRGAAPLLHGAVWSLKAELLSLRDEAAVRTAWAEGDLNHTRPHASSTLFGFKFGLSSRSSRHSISTHGEVLYNGSDIELESVDTVSDDDVHVDLGIGVGVG